MYLRDVLSLSYSSCCLSSSLGDYLNTDTSKPPSLGGTSLFSCASDVIKEVPLVGELRTAVEKIISDGNKETDFCTSQIKAFIDGAVKHATDFDSFVEWFKSWKRSCGEGMKKIFDDLPDYFVLHLSQDPSILHFILLLGNYATFNCFENMPKIFDDEGKLIGKGYEGTRDNVVNPSNACIVEAQRNNPTNMRRDVLRNILGEKGSIESFTMDSAALVDCVLHPMVTPPSKNENGKRPSQSEREKFLEQQRDQW